MGECRTSGAEALSQAFGDAATTLTMSQGVAPDAELALVRSWLAGLPGARGADLLVSRPRPTAAFSRRDALLPGYGLARSSAEERGFAPVVRPVGGHLAIYDQGALTLHLVAPHADPRSGVRERFVAFGSTMTTILRARGVDARVGALAGEFCEGAYSVNLAGRSKLVGTGQRIVRGGYLFSALVMVSGGDSSRVALVDAYRVLGISLDVATVGCLADAIPGVTWELARDLVVEGLRALVPIADTGSARASG